MGGVAVVLAGGLGTRLRPLTYTMPKPMLPLGGKPLLERTIEKLKASRIEDIVVATFHLGRVIKHYFGDGSEYGVKITYVRSDKPLGTAGQLKTVERYVDEDFIVIYGDVYADMDYRSLLEWHRRSRGIGTIVLREVKQRLKFGLVKLNEEGLVMEWVEKPEVGYLVAAGVFAFNRRIFNYIYADRPDSMDKAILRAMEKGEKVYGYRSNAKFVDVGDIDSYVKVNEEFEAAFGDLA